MRIPVEPVIIGALNHLLASQSWARARLVPHAGDAIRLEFGPTVVELAIAGDGQFESADGRTPAVTIAVPLGALPRLLTRDAQARREVTVTGNVGLAADLEYLFANLRWDVEADLSRVVGDVAAHRLSRAGEAAARVPGEVAASFARSTRQFLTEEQPVVARAEEVSGFVAEVDHLRDDAERLAKRVALLEAKRSRRPS
jgi:ubiquinone biosynthesis protein UbiJ